MNLFKKKKKKIGYIEPCLSLPKLRTQIKMQDGKIKEYSTDFLITDKENCVICPDYPFVSTKYYHLYFNCRCLKHECEKTRNIPLACTVKAVKANNYVCCPDCSSEVYHYIHDPVDEKDLAL